ncbi:hypothetical protein KSD_20980 [Ktedonobacter sp. SOSP1-85]|nr:hypothetical protein KSD_20980 [Ktedonobacter sp. SOSP1-85]
MGQSPGAGARGDLTHMLSRHILENNMPSVASQALFLAPSGSQPISLTLKGSASGWEYVMVGLAKPGPPSHTPTLSAAGAKGDTPTSSCLRRMVQ